MTVDDRVRALPGMDGAIHATLPVVDRDIDDNAWNVTLDVAGHVNLIALFQAIADNPALRDATRILMHNRANLDLQLWAVRELLDVDDVRKALTITLGPSQAEDLAEALAEVVKEPERCQAGEGDCSNYVVDDKSYDEFDGLHKCPYHLATAQDD